MRVSNLSLTTATRLALITLSLFVFVSAPASAAASAWVAAGTTSNFTEVANWSATPGSLSDLNFGSGTEFGAKPAPFNDNATAMSLNNINIVAAYTISGAGVALNGINDSCATAATVSMPLATQGTAVMTLTVTNAPGVLYLTGVLSGGGPVTFGGPGHTVLSAANTFTGITSVNAGTVHIWGSQPGVTNVSAGTLVLANDSTIGNVTLGGLGSTLSCNETFATKTMHGTIGNLVVSGSSRFLVITKGPSEYTNVNVANVDLSGGSLIVDTSTYMPTSSAVMTIIHNASGTVTGTFTSQPEGSTVVSSTNVATTFTISYLGGAGGHDVTLTGRPGNGAGTAGGTSTGWATGTTAGTSGAATSSGHHRRCGLGGGGLAMLLALGLYAARRKA